MAEGHILVFRLHGHEWAYLRDEAGPAWTRDPAAARGFRLHEAHRIAQVLGARVLPRNLAQMAHASREAPAPLEQVAL